MERLASEFGGELESPTGSVHLVRLHHSFRSCKVRLDIIRIRESLRSLTVGMTVGEVGGSSTVGLKERPERVDMKRNVVGSAVQLSGEVLHRCHQM